MKKINKILILLLAIFMLTSNFNLNMVYAEDDNNNQPPEEEIIPPVEDDKPTAEEILVEKKTSAKNELFAHALTIEDVEWTTVTEVRRSYSSKIDAATTVEKVAEELEKGKQALDSIEKIKPPVEEPKPEPKPPVEDKPKPPKDEPVEETPLSQNNNLSSLTVSGESLNFNPQTTTYRLVVDNNVSSVRVSATPEDKRATLTGTGLKYLDVYNNEIAITVTSEGGSSKVYTINIVRLDSEGNEEEVLASSDLSSLKIEGCDLNFTPETLDYECEVDHLITTVKIVAEAYDKDAVVEVENIDKLKVGDNLVKIIVKAVNGETKTYTVTINRSKTISPIEIKDLAKALESAEVEKITVLLDSSETVSKFLMQKIKESKKTVYFNKLDNNEDLLYSWRIDGSKITFVDNLYTGVAFESDKDSKLNLLVKDVSGLILAFKDNPSLPLNTKVGVNVEGKFKNRAKLNLYYYDSLKDDLSLEESDIRVKDDMIWLNLSHTSEYFLTSENLKGEKNSISITFIISLVIFVLLLAIGIREYLKKNRKHKIQSVYLDIDSQDLSLKEEDYSKVVWGRQNKDKIKK